jgi:hypothetical protein
MTTTTNARTYAITDAEYAVLEAALELTGASFGGLTLAERMTNNLRTQAPKEWHALVAALDKARAAEDPCDTCKGTGEIAKPCCSGRDCGCNGNGVSDSCPECNERGWVL